MQGREESLALSCSAIHVFTSAKISILFVSLCHHAVLTESQYIFVFTNAGKVTVTTQVDMKSLEFTAKKIRISS